MQRVTEKDTVTITYEGRLTDGTLFESTTECGPLSFQIGGGTVLPAFEKAVIGMAEQETKTITLLSEEGFGARNEELVIQVPRKNFGDFELTQGATVGMNMDKDGQTHTLPATVVEVGDKSVTVDFNHPLAGHELNYTITLQSIGESVADSGSEKGSACNPSGCKGCSS